MDWIPAISTSTLLGVALWLSGKVILTRLTNSVRHEYEDKIENLRASLRQTEESFKAELRAKESQIEALRSGALSGIATRQATLYQRQLLAVEQLWEAFNSLAPAKSVSSWMAVVKFDIAATEAARNPKLRELFKSIDSTSGMTDLGMHVASKARPFVSPLAWAYYSAYQAIVTHSVLRLKALQLGLEDDFADIEGITKLIKVALPHQTEYIEKYGPSAFYYLLDELEQSLLTEFGNMLSGQKADKEHIEKATRILKESEQVINEKYSFATAE